MILDESCSLVGITQVCVGPRAGQKDVPGLAGQVFSVFPGRKLLGKLQKAEMGGSRCVIRIDAEEVEGIFSAVVERQFHQLVPRLLGDLRRCRAFSLVGRRYLRSSLWRSRLRCRSLLGLGFLLRHLVGRDHQFDQG